MVVYAVTQVTALLASLSCDAELAAVAAVARAFAVGSGLAARLLIAVVAAVVLALYAAEAVAGFTD